jgi:hypothetical protein
MCHTFVMDQPFLFSFLFSPFVCLIPHALHQQVEHRHGGKYVLLLPC